MTHAPHAVPRLRTPKLLSPVTARRVLTGVALGAGCFLASGLAPDLAAQNTAVAPASTAKPMLLASVDSPAATGTAWSSSSTPVAAPLPDAAALPAAALPDAPSPVAAVGVPAADGSDGAPPQQNHASVSPLNNKAATPGDAPRYAKYISWNEHAYGPLTPHDKILIGAKDLYSVGNIGAAVFSAAYEQVVDGAPNYGHPDSFGKRIGAGFIRETSQGVFADMVFNNVFKTDPRYFQLGPRHNVVKRTVYSISRVFITRTDSGRSTLNAALLAGYASSSALQLAYYPQINRNFKDTASEYGGSIGGAALGNFLTEFAPDILHALHLDKLHY